MREIWQCKWQCVRCGNALDMAMRYVLDVYVRKVTRTLSIKDPSMSPLFALFPTQRLVSNSVYIKVMSYEYGSGGRIWSEDNLFGSNCRLLKTRNPILSKTKTVGKTQLFYPFPSFPYCPI